MAFPNIASADTSVIPASAGVGTVSRDLLAAAASRSDLEGLETCNCCSAGVVPDIDGLGAACAARPAVEGHDRGVGCDG